MPETATDPVGVVHQLDGNMTRCGQDAATAAETPATPEPKTYRPFLDVLLQIAGNPPLPDGYDTWGFKITRPDLRTYDRGNGRFRWPWPGGTVTDENTVVNGQACPTIGTGGFCIALDPEGARSGGYGHATILLLAYRISDVVGEDEHKRRVSHCLVADVIAGQDAYGKAAGADLRRADLQGADLQGADLQRADLRRADLRGADLQRADLRGADLRRADLQRADLWRADLRGADLQGADLRRDQVTDAQVKQFRGEPSWLS